MTELAELIAAIREQAAAIDRLAQSNMALVDLIADNVSGDDRPDSAQYLDGSRDGTA